MHKMEQAFSCSTLALQNTDILEGIRKKKTDVICNSLPLGCDIIIFHMQPFSEVDSTQYK